jgi:hypothetical protein
LQQNIKGRGVYLLPSRPRKFKDNIIICGGIRIVWDCKRPFNHHNNGSRKAMI